ncbi:hypothetical protein NWFMUON74_34670 [Nocardia wallacei]|uniref:Uncharacterized protein n=1 Tax=Nocardia wallacei TaxID=480035 RepID=A0A7G1KKA0_9NOCA|nr:hypothetical protein NWFMUON74_34670 [Nocardia wallacei]
MGAAVPWVTTISSCGERRSPVDADRSELLFRCADVMMTVNLLASDRAARMRAIGVERLLHAYLACDVIDRAVRVFATPTRERPPRYNRSTALTRASPHSTSWQPAAQSPWSSC